jgi:hypothetical protein
MRARSFVVAALASLALAASAFAQGAGQAGSPPRVVNGHVTPHAIRGDLDATFRGLVSAGSEPEWIGYTVPTAATGDRQLCCNGDTWISDGMVITNGRLATCGLEPGDQTTRTSGGQTVANQGPIHLEGPESMVVLFRVEDKAVQRIRFFSPDCELDAGGRTIHWLDPVSGADSITLLSAYVSHADVKSDRLTDSAIAGIAMHKDASADSALARMSSPKTYPEFVRKKVTFWLGNARGHAGFEAVRKIAQDDPSEEVRKSAMFGLSQSADANAIPELIRFARNDASPKVRGEAIFWLAQKAGQQASSQITASIENDPDTDVKKRAVFALSQLPKDEGVPLLINVAKTNKNPVVRKQAMFWLGQSRDPRALDFFAQILK